MYKSLPDMPRNTLDEGKKYHVRKAGSLVVDTVIVDEITDSTVLVRSTLSRLDNTAARYEWHDIRFIEEAM